MGYLNAVGKYGKSSGATVDGLKVVLCSENTQAEDALGEAKGVVMHWTAGTYNQCFNAYHYNIVFDPTTGKAHVVKNLKLTTKGQHVWGRNTGLIGVSFAAMRGAVNTTNHPGPYPITEPMMVVAAKLVAEICAWKKIDPRSNITMPKKVIQGNSLVTVAGTISVPTVFDHYTIAKLDGYGSDRWDISGGGDLTLLPRFTELMLQHYDGLKSGKHKFEYLGVIKE